ncbi:hypothetical protein RDI58_018466 [Solanum bulbocastanum]|uniref:BHLH domain-containing protein n=1 Tax=Solanum bulbocastanum TaxID=147425 RepID=A0AAN8TGK8_SOLBU
MERKLPLVQQEFNAGEALLLPLMESDEAFINGMYNGLSYQSLLSLNLDHSYYGEVKPFSAHSSNFRPSFTNDMLCAGATFHEFSTGDSAWFNKKTEINPDADQQMKFPKLEPVADNLQLYPYNNEDVLSEPFNYFSNGFGYHSLPDLRCIEQPNYLDFSSSLVTTENRVVEPVRPASVVMSSLLKNRQPYSSSTTRLRRQKLSEKIRCLEKLLPWDKKMDTATMLEEAYKYVKFLQAQISVLQSMPPLVEGGASSDQDRNGKSTSYGSNHEAKAISIFGTLARLNRQQLLQVLLNSPVTQTYLYSKGCCIYSVEQLVQYRKISQRNAFYRRSLFFNGMLS